MSLTYPLVASKKTSTKNSYTSISSITHSQRTYLVLLLLLVLSSTIAQHVHNDIDGETSPDMDMNNYPELNDDNIHLAIKYHLTGEPHYGPIDSWNTTLVTNTMLLFFNAKSFDVDISQWDVSNVTNMDYMFYNASSFNSDISHWNISHVTSLQDTFKYARSFNSDISQWDTSHITYMKFAFAFTDSFNSDLSQWNVSNVTDMNYMFWNATSFNSNVSKWDVSYVTNMNGMFINTQAFEQELCWKAEGSMFQMFMDSPGRLIDYHDCMDGDSSREEGVEDEIEIEFGNIDGSEL